MLKRRVNKGKGDPGVSGLSPAEAEAFPENAGNFRDIGIGIGIGGAAAHDDKQGFMQRCWAEHLAR